MQLNQTRDMQSGRGDAAPGTRTLRRRRRLRRWALATALLLAVALGVGCSTCSFYRQAVVGHYRIVLNQRPIQQVLADPAQPAELKDKLRLTLHLRQFAEQQLRLPVNGHYQRYVDVGRRYVVWNVYAAPVASLEAKKWWYPFVGRLAYRGYFSEQAARRYAQHLAKQGWEVYVEGVEAYSTLGWFRDPVLNTFIRHEPADLAETLFHELAHQRLFVSGDTEFNEAFATAVSQHGVLCWLQSLGDSATLSRYRIGLEREAEFVKLVARTRQQLEQAYAQLNPGGQRRLPPDRLAAVCQAQQQIRAQFRLQYAQLKQQWGGDTRYDAWVAGPLNNAQLNTVATYYDWVPAFKQLLAEQQGDLERFYRAAARLGKLPKPVRHQRLKELCERARAASKQ
jgi:predicted aminopeptidase